MTITTVGYGDFFPVTTLGRLTGVFVMFAGVGIIGALASILASLLVSPAPAKAEETAGVEAAAAVLAGGATVRRVRAPAPVVTPSELAQTRAEMAQTRAEMAELRAPPGRDVLARPRWKAAVAPEG